MIVAVNFLVIIHGVKINLEMIAATVQLLRFHVQLERIQVAFFYAKNGIEGLQ